MVGIVASCRSVNVPLAAASGRGGGRDALYASPSTSSRPSSPIHRVEERLLLLPRRRRGRYGWAARCGGAAAEDAAAVAVAGRAGSRHGGRDGVCSGSGGSNKGCCRVGPFCCSVAAAARRARIVHGGVIDAAARPEGGACGGTEDQRQQGATQHHTNLDAYVSQLIHACKIADDDAEVSQLDSIEQGRDPPGARDRRGRGIECVDHAITHVRDETSQCLAAPPVSINPALRVWGLGFSIRYGAARRISSAAKPLPQSKQP